MNLISLTDLLDTHDAQHWDTQWLIPDLLPIGLTILQGPPRIGKSWLTLHLALSIALGTQALEHLPTTQTGVLYLGLQDTSQRIARRTRKLLNTQSAPDNFLWTDRWPTSSSTTDGIDALDLWLAAHPHTRLLVIDSLNGLSPTSWNTTADQNLELLQHLKALADKHRIAILVTDHHVPNNKRNARKENLYNASFIIADAIMTLKHEQGHAKATLLLTGNDLPDAEFALSLPASTMTWTLLGLAADYRLSQERQDILALLEEHRDGPLRPKEIASLLHKDVRAVTKLLFDMSRASQVRLIGRGHYMTIKTNTISDQQPSQANATLIAQLQQPSIGNVSNHSNIGNDGNHNNIGNDGNHSNIGNLHIGNASNHSNIGNDGNHSDIGNVHIGNDAHHGNIADAHLSNDSNRSNIGNHSHSTSTSLPNLPSHSSLDPNIHNPSNSQPFSPIDTESFLSNYPFIPQ